MVVLFATISPTLQYCLHYPARDAFSSPNDRSVIGFCFAIVAFVSSDYAIASAQGPLWIIHGHGTGKLRHGVQVFLTSHPRVERFEFAEQSDGGSGVTVAYCRN
jgi:DNA mismatch repair protein MutS2